MADVVVSQCNLSRIVHFTVPLILTGFCNERYAVLIHLFPP